MGTTSVPVPIFGPQGFIPPLESALIDGAKADINAAFSGKLNITTSANPQGQLATSIAAMIANCNAVFLQYTNMVDPALSYGRMQDGIGRIYFIERIPSAPTIVPCVCMGGEGVPIPVGAQAQDTLLNKYICTQAGEIPAGGTITLPFINIVNGPTPCPANTLTTIVQAIPGWDSINNPTAGVLGSLVESPSAFETRRSLSVALNSLGTLPSILGAVLSVPGVIDAYAYENPYGYPLAVGGLFLYPNSIYVCVLGGAAADVAKAIWTRKPPGSAYNGNIMVVVEDTTYPYTPPYPSYNVSYEAALPLPITMQVKLANSPMVPYNALALIQNAIVGAFAGLDGGPRARIGYNLLASRFYGPIAALGGWAQIVSLFLGSGNAPGAQFSGLITGNTLAISTLVGGAVAAGQSVFDATGVVTPGTVILNQIDGTPGGIGDYNVNISQDMGSIELMYGATPNLFEVFVNLNQYPIITPANISLILV